MKVLVTGAYGFLGKYVIKELADRNAAAGEKPVYEVKTMGLNPLNDYRADLIKETPSAEEGFDMVVHLCGTCRPENAGNVNAATTEHLIAMLEKSVPKQLVYISSLEVYGRTEGEGLTEGTVKDPTSRVGKSKLMAEDLLRKWAEERGVILTILRCPPIVGTGMTGPLRQMVNSIYRAAYHHIEDETQRVSVVHAVDVARAAVDLAPIGGVYNMTDGVDPSRRELAEAFACRLDGKRIYTLRARRARIAARIFDYLPFAAFDSAKLAERYRTLTYSADKVIGALGWRPNSVVDYLRNHVYDENSL